MSFSAFCPDLRPRLRGGMTAMMPAMAAMVVTAFRVVVGLPPVRVYAGARLLTRSDLSPTGQSQYHDRRKSQYQTLHIPTLPAFFL
jgi:hypothetical protein